MALSSGWVDGHIALDLLSLSVVSDSNLESVCWCGLKNARLIPLARNRMLSVVPEQFFIHDLFEYS
jgi:hypothetical protein